jgi:S1-C subfamily serine protease
LKPAMVALGPISKSRLFLPFTLSIAMLIAGISLRAEDSHHKLAGDITLVRIDILAESGGRELVEINGRRIPDYRPKIIQAFTATGVVLDDQTNILTFLGYRWVEMESPKPKIHVTALNGERYEGRLVGIDQSVGVAVIAAPRGKLSRTPLCERCAIKDEAFLVTRISAGPGSLNYQPLQIRSVGQAGEDRASEVWEVTLNRPMPETGGPILDAQRRVLGFVASQQPSPDDPMGVRTIVYPISQLLRSAQKILHQGGDIRTGWLGIFLDEPPSNTKKGVVVKSVLQGSPAQKAGLRAEDALVKWNGREIRDSRQFISLVQDTPIGSKANIHLLRKDQALSVVALIEARRPPERSERISLNFPLSAPQSAVEHRPGTAQIPEPASTWIGIETAALTAQLAEFLQIPGKTGLLVAYVEAQTPFEQAGIQVGDVILTVDHQPILDPRLFSSLLQMRRGGAPLLIHLLRKGNLQTTEIQLPPAYTPPARKP